LLGRHGAQAVAGDGRDDDTCGENSGVTIGKTFQRGRRSGKRSGRCRRLPGGWRCDQIGRKRSDGVAMIEGAVTGGEEEVDAGNDSRAPRLDFLHAEMEENVRVLVVLSEQRGTAELGRLTARRRRYCEGFSSSRFACRGRKRGGRERRDRGERKRGTWSKGVVLRR
jgi:hypothetical protein